MSSALRLTITGTDTDVGKTVFAAGLAGHLRARYWKPVQAGLEGETDSEVVARLSGGHAQVLPEMYRLTTPCSPHEAARIDGVTIDPARLALPGGEEALLVEGAGGVLVPHGANAGGGLLAADLFALWQLPVVLVARTALGTINHSLLSLEALRARKIAVHGIVFSGDANPASEEAITRIGQVRHLGRLPRLDPLNAGTLAAAFAAHIDLRGFRVTSPVWHPFTQHGLQEPIPLVTHAEGAVLHTADGQRIIDAISSWWVTTHGHCHPKIMAAIAAQANTLDQIIFAGWTHEPAEELARRLVEIVPRPLDHVFYSDSGSTSVEVALKMALGFWANRGEPRHRIVVMQHSYHGDTFGGMSVGERGVFNRAYQALLFDVTTVPFPMAGAEQATLDALEAACARGDAAAFIVEPLILGAGGMLVYPPQILAEMHAICARHNVLFIADEVMTGWGRTGTLFACEQAGVVPDILCLSKGLTGGSLPLAVTLAKPHIYAAHYSNDRAKQFFHSSSYTANPIACAAALANLDVWRDEPVMERIGALAARQAKGLATLALIPGIANPRQCGTMIAVDIAVGDAGYLADVGPQLKAFFTTRGLLLRPLGNTVYVMPPYCISAEDLATVHAAIAEAAGVFGAAKPLNSP